MKEGLFKYIVMLFGLANCPTFLSVMNMTFEDMLNRFVTVYLDDILVFSANKYKHLVHMR